VFSRADEWGEFYSVSLPVVGPSGKTAVVQTVWKIETGTAYPSFVTVRTVKEVR
jgi:hypothetical protein